MIMMPGAVWLGSREELYLVAIIHGFKMSSFVMMRFRCPQWMEHG